MNRLHTLPRLVGRSLAERLAAMPAVVVTGARQTGKSTLAQDLSPGVRRYFTLDDLETIDRARREPDTLISGPDPITLDEVQREPDLLRAVKRAIDRGRRKPGQFLLTGSANLLLMKRVSESLAGRASYLTLWPMTRREQAGLGTAGVWDELLVSDEKKWPQILKDQTTEPTDWRAAVRRGGYPTPAVHMKTSAERSVWFDGYVRTYLERDLQDLSAISALPDFRRLMRAVCLRLGQLVNQAEMGRDLGLPQPTVHRYLNLLETSYQLIRLSAYSVNRTKRLIKSPKLYWADPGLALHLGEGEPQGSHLENLVLQDLLVWRDARVERADVHYWRTASGEEVDFVVESSGRLLPIEIKAASQPRLSDVIHLQSFREEYGTKARAGLLLHTGGTVEWLAPGILAAPWWRAL